MAVVNVAALTATDTSRAPWIAAFVGSMPNRLSRTMFSSTTTALSTSMPIPSISPMSEMRFSDRMP